MIRFLVPAFVQTKLDPCCARGFAEARDGSTPFNWLCRAALLSVRILARRHDFPDRGLSGRSAFGMLKRAGFRLDSFPGQRAAPRMGAVRSVAAAPCRE